MNEQDVRALVREAIERHLGRPERSAGAEHDDRPAGHQGAGRSIAVHSFVVPAFRPDITPAILFSKFALAAKSMTACA
jgi:hypothetical protein